MTITDLRCDLCGSGLVGSAILQPQHPRAGVRLYIHPGDPLHRDDQALVCRSCWEDLRAWIGEQGRGDRCAVCGEPVTYEGSLHLLEMTGRVGEAPEWQFCRIHALDLLNGFRFVDPKLGAGELVLKADFTAG